MHSLNCYLLKDSVSTWHSILSDILPALLYLSYWDFTYLCFGLNCLCKQKSKSFKILKFLKISIKCPVIIYVNQIKILKTFKYFEFSLHKAIFPFEEKPDKKEKSNLKKDFYADTARRGFSQNKSYHLLQLQQKHKIINNRVCCSNTRQFWRRIMFANLIAIAWFLPIISGKSKNFSFH